jgi:hypothetical protein
MTISGNQSMRALAVVMLGSFLALAVGSGAGARPRSDRITGGFTDAFGERVGLQARSGPNGENASGRETATRPGDTRYRLKVTCLAVAGNLAAYSTLMVKSNNPSFPVGTRFVEVVRDGGLPGGEGDGWFIFDVPPADPSNCADFLDEAASAEDILGGNITVLDAQG